MKKILIISAALVAMTAISCSKTQLPADEAACLSGKTMKVTATVGDATKTYLSETAQNIYKVKWAENDVIAVNGYKSTGITLIEGGLSAEFTIPEEAAADNYCAVYPGMLYRADTFAEGKCDVFVSSVQKYVEGTYDPESAIIAAYSDDPQKLHFQQLMAYYKLTFEPGEGATSNIASIVVSAAGQDKNIAGTYTVTFGETCTLAASSLNNVITVDCGETGIPCNSTVFIALPAKDYSTDGLLVAVSDMDGKGVTYLVKPDLSTKAGIVLGKTLTFSPTANVIMTADDWEEFAAAVNAGKVSRFVSGATVSLGADITLNNYTQIAKLDCTFDGAGHTISCAQASKPLFGTINGGAVVKNLITEGAWYSQNILAENLAGGAIEDCLNKAAINATVSGETHAAAFVWDVTGGSMTRCENAGNITVTTTTSSAVEVYAGGLVAHVEGTFTMTDCKNTGALTVDVDNTGCKIYHAGFAGIAGYVSRDWANEKYPEIHFNNCDNEGTITVSTNGEAKTTGLYGTFVAGIVGLAWGDFVASNMDPAWYACGADSNSKNQNKVFFKDCDNSGTIHSLATSYCESYKAWAKPYVAGLVGAMNAFDVVYNNPDTPVFDNCTSSGDVIPYDNDASGCMTRCAYESVSAGLVGLGRNLTFKNCVVTAKIGTAKRLAFAIAGGIGIADGPNSFDGCKFFPDITFFRNYDCGKFNYSIVANNPRVQKASQKMQFAGSALPEMTGHINNCELGAANILLSKAEISATVIDLSYEARTNVTTSKAGDLDKCQANAVSGSKSDDGTALSAYSGVGAGKVTVSGNSCITAAPTGFGTEVTPPACKK